MLVNLDERHGLDVRFRRRTGAVPPVEVLVRFVSLASWEPDQFVAAFAGAHPGWRVLALHLDHLSWVESSPDDGSVVAAWARPVADLAVVRVTEVSVRAEETDGSVSARVGFELTFTDNATVIWPAALASPETTGLLATLLHGDTTTQPG